MPLLPVAPTPTPTPASTSTPVSHALDLFDKAVASVADVADPVEDDYGNDDYDYDYDYEQPVSDLASDDVESAILPIYSSDTEIDVEKAVDQLSSRCNGGAFLPYRHEYNREFTYSCIKQALTDLAAKHDSRVSSFEGALAFWDEVAKRHWNRPDATAEILLMSKCGALVARVVPKEQRRFDDSVAQQLGDPFANYEAYKDTPAVRARVSAMVDIGWYLEDWAENPDKAHVAKAIMWHEFCFPACQGKFKPGFFRVEKGRAVLDAAKISMQDQSEILSLVGQNIPFFQGGADQVQNHLDANRLKRFFGAYREAEKLIDDGDHDIMHCGCSTKRVRHVLLKAGIPSVKMGVFRHYTWKGEELLLGGLVGRIAKDQNLSPRDVQAVLAHASGFEGAFDLNGWQNVAMVNQLAEDYQLDKETVRAIVHYIAIWQANQYPAVKREIDFRSGWGHSVAVARIQGALYLIDINGQQFGEEFDRLEFWPVEEAIARGFFIDGTVADLEAKVPQTTAEMDFGEQLELLDPWFMADQYIIDAYMRMLAEFGP